MSDTKDPGDLCFPGDSELASRLRDQHARWRRALLDSLREAVFLVDEDGDVIEINAAFTAILGYGPEGLPYRTRPWWLDEQDDPEGYLTARENLVRLMADKQGIFTAPMRCRDGRRIWTAGTFNEVTEPESGRRMVVGTFRDITAEHEVIQRDSALAAMAMVLSRADSAAEVLREALGELRRLWHAQKVTAATWRQADQVAVMSTSSVDSWEDLSAELREALERLRHQPVLTPMTAWPAGVGIRLEHPAGVLGIWIELGSGRLLTAEDRTLLRLIGGYLAQALHRVHQTDQHREAALILQRAILGPARLPDGFAARYEPASRPLEVGGDWYDIIELPDGRIGIIVGDCVGHDLGAATGMGQLRSACRALLLQDASASRTLTAADTFASFVPSAEFATVFCGILDPETGSLTYSSAAHPPGIVIPADGPVDHLDGGRSLPLAVPHDEPRTDAEYVLPPRSTLLLYTDGLVERRGHVLTEGIDAAGTAVRDAGDLSLEDLATRVMSELAPPAGYDDDVAVVLYHHPGPLDVTFPAEPGQLAPVRTRLRQWLNRSGVTGQTAQNVLVAAGEAVTNAIEHGHRDSPSEPVRLRAVSAPGQLRLTVTDSGRWQPSPPEEHWLRGQGIGLMQALTEHVSISPDPAGTVVDIYVRIGDGNPA